MPAGDEIVTASADTGGYHLFAASAGGGWRWQPLATLQPAGYDGERWIGERCITGDGRYVVAVVAPWRAQNSPAGMAAGGIAYVIDAHTGEARPLAAGVAVTYFNPGCGLDGTAALTMFTPDQTRTQVLVADLRSATVRTLPMMPGELTSAVPAGGDVLAARGNQLVAMTPTGARAVANVTGQVFSLRPNADGGVDFLSVETGHGTDPAAGAFSWSPGHGLLSLGHAGVHELRLYAGAGGHNIMIGAASTPAGQGMPAASDSAGPAAAPVTRVAANGVDAWGMSLHGQVTLRGVAALVHPADGAAVAGSSRSLPAPARAATSLPPTLPASSAAAPRQRLSAHVQTEPGAGARLAGSRASEEPPPPPLGDPTCAVPRLNDRYQVPQPSSAQIQWANKLAGSGRLTGPGGSNLRPAGFDNLAGGGYSPSDDFSLPAPFGSHGQFVPEQILDGIMAQESNWNQASPHAPQGLAGDPYIADYYGYNKTGTIDYTHADCGYGLGQITDQMRLAPGQTDPNSLQARVAVDYAENAAAAARTLALKWNDLQRDGITIDPADPSVIEDWYFAVWAYNSGIDPQASTGNTTGCRPGDPGCTDEKGNWGLGWTNNPANPAYNPARFPFLHHCDPTPPNLCAPDYSDAASPEGWPYQEKVFGWIETPQFEPNSITTRYPGTFNYITQDGYFLNQPARSEMCDSSDHCNYLAVALPGGQPCAYSTEGSLQWHCWWHQPINDVCTGTLRLLTPCHHGDTATSQSPEPAVANPFPATCSNTLPADTIIVDDNSPGSILWDDQAGLNLAGCPGEKGPGPGSSSGTFEWFPGEDFNARPTGMVDLHQLGTGYGGHTLFAHLQDPANQQWAGTGQWKLSAGYDVYDVSAFIPALGASGTLSYYIHDGLGHQLGGPIPINQADYTNQWVSLGRFYLGRGATVTASSVVPGGDGITDVAFDAMAFSPVPSYAALGDSYSSGVGVGSANYDGPLTNVAGGDACLRSPDSYPRQFGEANGYPGPLTVHLACTDAKIANLTTTSLHGAPPQITAIPKHVHLVTVTIGGNDVGFADVLKHCLLPKAPCEADYTQNNTNPAAAIPVNLDYTIANLEPGLESAFSQIKAQAPTARIIALTYPSIFQPTSTQSCRRATVRALPAQDVEWLISETNNLDNQIVTAARNMGIQALDERYGFAGHELCASDPWVNGALRGIPDAFHPTISGYTKEASELGDAYHNPALFVPPLDTDGRGSRPGTPNPRVALELLGLLRTNNMGTYNDTGWNVNKRGWFNQPKSTDWRPWPVFDNCDTQRRVLRRDARPGTWNKSMTNACNADAPNPEWWDPYQARFFSSPVPAPPPATKDTPTADHVIPLKNAWSLGAADQSQQPGKTWTEGMRADFANDVRGLELLTISNSANGSKSDRAIDRWVPPNPDYRCTYAEMWTTIKYQWNLKITSPEYDALQKSLTDDCKTPGSP